MQAYANPSAANHNAAGYGIVRFNKPDRKITMECWPRHSDVTQPQTQQYPGWPITIRQEDNYARQPLAFLPTIRVSGQQDPVVQVVDEYLDEVVYTIRIQGSSWRPKVFRNARYTIRVGEGESVKQVQGVQSTSTDEQKFLDFTF